MKPVAIFRHARSEGPGHCASFLDQNAIAHRLFAVDAGESLPRRAREFAGLVFMGGPMSVNDDLPWIAPTLALIRDALHTGVPVLGHCLGGQLLARSLGAEVRRTPVKEIGWGTVQVSNNSLAREWFGKLDTFEAFHWHADTFSIPPGATRVLENTHCPNQAFAIGRHFGMQCHLEMTAALIRSWCRLGEGEIVDSGASPAVQTVEQILENLDARTQALNQVANRVYARWAKGLSGLNP